MIVAEIVMVVMGSATMEKGGRAVGAMLVTVVVVYVNGFVSRVNLLS